MKFKGTVLENEFLFSQFKDLSYSYPKDIVKIF